MSQTVTDISINLCARLRNQLHDFTLPVFQLSYYIGHVRVLVCVCVCVCVCLCVSRCVCVFVCVCVPVCGLSRCQTDRLFNDGTVRAPTFSFRPPIIWFCESHKWSHSLALASKHLALPPAGCGSVPAVCVLCI